MSYHNFAEMLSLADEGGKALWEVVLENEMALGEMDEEAVFCQLAHRFSIMKQSASKALHGPLTMPGALISGVAQTQERYAGGSDTLCGPLINRVMALALSCSEVNASMGKICACPTAGACGVLPGVLVGLGEDRNLSERRLLEGLLTASGVGAVIVQNATVSGAEAGCQAECGAAATMAAAAAVELAGGSPEASLHAAAIVMMNAMGLVCDPVAGLVQVPCAQRNASQAVNALISADMALGGMRSVIPPDEVLEAMYRTGRELPVTLRETALGGIAATPTGREIKDRIM